MLLWVGFDFLLIRLNCLLVYVYWVFDWVWVVWLVWFGVWGCWVCRFTDCGFRCLGCGFLYVHRECGFGAIGALWGAPISSLASFVLIHYCFGFLDLGCYVNGVLGVFFAITVFVHDVLLYSFILVVFLIITLGCLRAVMVGYLASLGDWVIYWFCDLTCSLGACDLWL